MLGMRVTSCKRESQCGPMRRVLDGSRMTSDIMMSFRSTENADDATETE